MAMPDVDEKDWKIFRKIHEAAMEREARKIVEELEKIGKDPNKNWHERYLATADTLWGRQREMSRVFDDFRRSTMFQQLVIMRTRGIISEADMAPFSERLRSSMDFLMKPRPDDDD